MESTIVLDSTGERASNKVTRAWTNGTDSYTKTYVISSCRSSMPFYGCALRLIVEDFPRGFPKLARFLDSDDNFMVYRRFGTVCSRLILSKQDEISKMERLLHSMDKMDARGESAKYLMSHTLDVERDGIPELWPESRPQLMEKLEKKILEYG